MSRNKRNNQCNFNFHEKGKPQFSKFRGKNKSQRKSKNEIGKYYYCGKNGYFIKECFKKIFDIKKSNSDGSISIAYNNELDILEVVIVTVTGKKPKRMGS